MLITERSIEAIKAKWNETKDQLNEVLKEIQRLEKRHNYEFKSIYDYEIYDKELFDRLYYLERICEAYHRKYIELLLKGNH